MTEYKTLRVPEGAYKAAKDSKRDDETWGEFLQRCSKNPPAIKRFVEATDEGDTDDTDTDALAREVSQQFDYTALADKVSEQVVRELQR